MSKNKNTYKFDNMEAFRKLKTNIEFSAVEKPIKVVNITSSCANEGKSTVAFHLAQVYAAKYKKVLVIDCDLRRPKMHRYFQISNQVGLSDLLVFIDKQPDLSTYIQEVPVTDCENAISVLTSGSKVPNPQELLGSSKFKKLLQALSKQYDFIILDCPPISMISDTFYVSNVSDGTIFVISMKDTKKDIALSSIRQLERSRSKILGIVLTKTQNLSSYDYYYTYE